MRKLNLEGMQFGRLLVLAENKKLANNSLWKTRCACGTEKFVALSALRSGAQISCGCKRKENKSNLIHGLTKHPLHKIWRGMRARCRSVTNPAYPHYGGRGIKICERWDKFEVFYGDMIPTWKPGLWIDRNDPDGNYEPGNCSWETPREQARNKRCTVRIVTPDGEMLLADAARKYGIRHPTLYQRWKIGIRGDALVAKSKRSGTSKPFSLSRVSTAQLISELVSRGFKLDEPEAIAA